MFLQVEKCDAFNGFLTLLSLAGGTGSGVGAYLNQCLRDEYPHCFILNQVVWPYRYVVLGRVEGAGDHACPKPEPLRRASFASTRLLGWTEEFHSSDPDEVCWYFTPNAVRVHRVQ